MSKRCHYIEKDRVLGPQMHELAVRETLNDQLTKVWKQCLQ